MKKDQVEAKRPTKFFRKLKKTQKMSKFVKK